MPWQFEWSFCDRVNLYHGPDKIYPARHGADCPGHRDDNVTYNLRPINPDEWPLPDPRKWWGLYREDILDVNPRYL
jgi:hypothetical protein